MNQAVAVEQSTVEAIIDARRERARLSVLFKRRLAEDAYHRLIAVAEAHPSPEEHLEHRLLRAAVEAAAGMEGFDGPLETTLNARLTAVFRQVQELGPTVLFPDH